MDVKVYVVECFEEKEVFVGMLAVMETQARQEPGSCTVYHDCLSPQVCLIKLKTRILECVLLMADHLTALFLSVPRRAQCHHEQEQCRCERLHHVCCSVPLQRVCQAHHPGWWV